MKTILVILAVVGVLTGLLFAWRTMTAMTFEQFDVDVGITDAMLIPSDTAATRPFRMGFTYQPYDWSDEAFAQTFAYLRNHGDLITFFHDVGLPWSEALAGAPLPPGLEQELQRQEQGATDFANVVVMLSVLGPDRISLAPTVDESGTVPRSGAWGDRTFDDGDVISAYLNHARTLIRRLEPDYFGYVAEVDSALVDVNDERFQSLLRFSQTVYSTLKQEFPKLIVFAEFNLSDDAYMARRQDVINAMLPLTDLYAVSTYADQVDGIAGDATQIPENWFDRVRSIAPSKPFAVLETGFIAEPFMHSTQGIRIAGQSKRLLIPGGPRSQALFAAKLLEAANRLDAEFVNLWAVRDLDLLFGRFDPGSELHDPMLRLAQDRGLYDETGAARPALDVWDQWRLRALVPASSNRPANSQ